MYQMPRTKKAERHPIHYITRGMYHHPLSALRKSSRERDDATIIEARRMFIANLKNQQIDYGMNAENVP